MTKRRAAEIFFAVVLTLLGVACGGSHGSPRGANTPKSTDLDLARTTTNDSATPGDVAWSSSTHAGATSTEVPVTGRDAVWGNGDAPVTIMVFTDFQCPFCSRAHPRVTQLMREYGPSKLRVVFKHNPLPFHQDAVPAALAAQAVYELAGASAFFAYVELVFQGQAQLSDANLLAWAAQVGVDRGALIRKVGSRDFQAKLEADMALAQRVGLSGTPAFLVNGSRLIGAQPYEAFKSLVDDELVAAQKLRSAAPSLARCIRHASPRICASPLPMTTTTTAPVAPPPPDTTVWKVPVGKSPSMGPANALVTLVEFSDFECPFCKKGHKTVHETPAPLSRQDPRRLQAPAPSLSPAGDAGGAVRHGSARAARGQGLLAGDPIALRRRPPPGRLGPAGLGQADEARRRPREGRALQADAQGRHRGRHEPGTMT